MNNPVPFIVNANSLTVFVDGRTFAVTASNKLYNMILDAIKIKNWDAVRGLSRMKDLIVLKSHGAISVCEDAIYYNGTPIHNALTNRILDMFANGFEIDPLIRFMDNLMQNPSQSAINELYDFLSCSELPITEDGHFLAYKMIRGDYKDIYSGTMDNAVGSVVEVPRETVDSDRNRTCSTGLHFASLNYVENGNYGSRQQGHRLVVLKINPRDVVSIPVDYNNSKGRACKYLILEEIDWSQRIPDSFVNTAGNSIYDIWDEPEETQEEDSNVWEEVQEEEPFVIPNRSLDDETVRNIRKALKQGWTLTEIANHYGTSRRTVGRIRDGQAYTDVK
jgi:hypothetical protein